MVVEVVTSCEGNGVYGVNPIIIIVVMDDNRFIEKVAPCLVPDYVGLDIDVVVVCNDTPPAMVDKIKKNWTNIIAMVSTEKRCYGGLAFNRGWVYAHQSNYDRYIMFDGDCLPTPGWGVELIRTMEGGDYGIVALPDKNIVRFLVQADDGSRHKLAPNRGEIPTGMRAKKGKSWALNGAVLCINDKTRDIVGFFDERAVALRDIEYTTRAAAMGVKMAYTRKGCFTHLRPQKHEKRKEWVEATMEVIKMRCSPIRKDSVWEQISKKAV